MSDYASWNSQSGWGGCLGEQGTALEQSQQAYGAQGYGSQSYGSHGYGSQGYAHGVTSTQHDVTLDQSALEAYQYPPHVQQELGQLQGMHLQTPQSASPEAMMATPPGPADLQGAPTPIAKTDSETVPEPAAPAEDLEEEDTLSSPIAAPAEPCPQPNYPSLDREQFLQQVDQMTLYKKIGAVGLVAFIALLTWWLFNYRKTSRRIIVETA